MPQIIEKRKSLNKQIELQASKNKELKAKLTKLQAMANLGKIAAIVAHEMNNILMPLGNYAQLALANLDDSQLVEKALNKTVANSIRASEILESIMAMVNGETAEVKKCSLLQLINEMFSSIARDFSKDKIKVIIDVDKDLFVNVVPVQFQQVIMNLVLNAAEAMKPQGGRLSIQATQQQDNTVLKISDTGCGIEKENLKNIFQPFFSTKTVDSNAQRNGSGIGLSFCADIIEAHNGNISVESELKKGTTFTITIPAKI